jgi:hypothetical protein
VNDAPVIDYTETRVEIDRYPKLLAIEQLDQIALVHDAVAFDVKSDQ